MKYINQARKMTLMINKILEFNSNNNNNNKMIRYK
jgi:hypothetical protein